MEAIKAKGERVRISTSSKQNYKIDNELKSEISFYGSQGKAAIDARLKELDSTWDIERTLEINAAILGLTGSLLAIFVNRKWAILPTIVTAFLAQHAIQGWCPPLPLFRAMGIKTRPEIDREKYALKALRGDFEGIENSAQAWEAVNK